MTRFGRKMFNGGRARRCRRKYADELTLADVPAGRQVCVRGFRKGLSGERQAHLQAYGLMPGHWVRILQHSPVTIVKIEHMELALENGLASQVTVEVDR